MLWRVNPKGEPGIFMCDEHAKLLHDDRLDDAAVAAPVGATNQPAEPTGRGFAEPEPWDGRPESSMLETAQFVNLPAEPETNDVQA